MRKKITKIDQTMDYESDMNIDQSSLDEEWLNQSNLCFKYAKLKAVANKQMLEAQERIKVVRSEIIKEIKETDPKATGVMIEASYRIDPRHKQAKENEIEAEYTHDLLMGATIAIAHRKSALENLVKLNGQEYYSEPKTTDKNGKEWEEGSNRRRMSKERRKK